MNTPVDSGPHDVVARLGFVPDGVVQEIGYDSDVDDTFRYAVEDACGSELEDEDYTGAVDAVLLWFRDGDGELEDALVDLVGVVEDDGFVVLLTPRTSREDHVEPSLVEEAVTQAGLHEGGRFTVGEEWRATKLVAPKGAPRR